MLLEGRAHSFDLLPKSANRGSPGALLWLKGEKEKEEERWTEEGTNTRGTGVHQQRTRNTISDLPLIIITLTFLLLPTSC